MHIEEDAKQRVEWINKRIDLTDQLKDYIEFQIKEAIVNAQREFNEINITPSSRTLSNVSIKLRDIIDCNYMSAWEEFCDKYGYNYYCVNEGADDNDEVRITVEDAKNWGLIK